MGFRIARKHAARLRRLAVLGGFAAADAAGAAGDAARRRGGAAGTLASAPCWCWPALLVERWLMFAEATHTVTLYYTGR